MALVDQLHTQQPVTVIGVLDHIWRVANLWQVKQVEQDHCVNQLCFDGKNTTTTTTTTMYGYDGQTSILTQNCIFITQNDFLGSLLMTNAARSRSILLKIS